MNTTVKTRSGVEVWGFNFPFRLEAMALSDMYVYLLSLWLMKSQVIIGCPIPCSELQTILLKELMQGDQICWPILTILLDSEVNDLLRLWPTQILWRKESNKQYMHKTRSQSMHWVPIMCQAWCCYFTCVIFFNKNCWECALHVTRHHSDVRDFNYSGGENMDCHRKVSSLHPNIVLTSNVSLCHCLISLDICILICKNEIEKDCIYHARDNICKWTL